MNYQQAAHAALNAANAAFCTNKRGRASNWLGGALLVGLRYAIVRHGAPHGHCHLSSGASALTQIKL
jgi:hypothetical protein